MDQDPIVNNPIRIECETDTDFVYQLLAPLPEQPQAHEAGHETGHLPSGLIFGKDTLSPNAVAISSEAAASAEKRDLNQ